MDEAAVCEYIAASFAGVDVVEGLGGYYFFTDPKHMMPFATLMLTDENDQASNLSRPGVYRLNIGVSKETFQSLFGTGEPLADESAYDFTQLDRLMPHPVYGKMYWTCVLNPSDETFETSVRRLLEEAYERDMRRRARHA